MRLRSPTDKVRRLRAFKASDAEWQIILGKAAQFTNGNVSQWIRYAATHLNPKRPVITKKRG